MKEGQKVKFKKDFRLSMGAVWAWLLADDVFTVSYVYADSGFTIRREGDIQGFFVEDANLMEVIE